VHPFVAAAPAAAVVEAMAPASAKPPSAAPVPALRAVRAQVHAVHARPPVLLVPQHERGQLRAVALVLEPHTAEPAVLCKCVQVQV
jgi:hypothetical protein